MNARDVCAMDAKTREQGFVRHIVITVLNVLEYFVVNVASMCRTRREIWLYQML